MEIAKFALDILVIGLLGAGIYFATRLEKQLGALRESRADMERLTKDFANNVGRAEAGIKSLKQVARESGDDLEKLLERAVTMRDELRFVVEHADKSAEKVSALSSQLASQTREAKTAAPPQLQAVATEHSSGAGGPRTRAEKELLHALEKMREQG
ncbi:MAG: DUF6468 domain-containing protein [Alphaproteobacteria bacterium]